MYIDLWLTVNLYIMLWLESQNNLADVRLHLLSVCLWFVMFYFLVLSTVRWNLNDVQNRWRLNCIEQFLW